MGGIASRYRKRGGRVRGARPISRFSDFFASGPETRDPPKPVAIAGNELASLVAPMSPETVIREVFAIEPCLIRGPRDKFHDLFSVAAFRDAIFWGERDRPTGYRGMRANWSKGWHKRSKLNIPIAYPDVGPALDEGATICVSGIHAAHPALLSFVRAVKSQLDYCGEVAMNCYLSPDGSGFPAHFDARAATVIQLAGTKTWRYSSAPAIPFPRGNASLVAGKPVLRGPDGSPREPEAWERMAPVAQDEFHEVVLEPGDVLLLPAGTWHAAQADGMSLALNLCFEARGFAAMLTQVLAPLLEGNAAWRAGPPPALGDAELAPPLPVRRYFAERIAELQNALDHLTKNDAALWQHWQAQVMRQPRGPWPGSRAGPTEPQKPRLRKSQLLRVAREVPIRYAIEGFADGESQACLYHGENELRYSAELVPLLRALCRKRRFRAGSVQRWAGRDVELPWTMARAWLEQLIESAVIEPVPSRKRSSRSMP